MIVECPFCNGSGISTRITDDIARSFCNMCDAAGFVFLIYAKLTPEQIKSLRKDFVYNK